MMKKNNSSKTGAMTDKVVRKATTKNRAAQKKTNKKQLENLKRIESEATSRRQIVERWQQLAQRVKYKRVASKASCVRTTQMLEEELFNGILLNLNERNSMKSRCSQKRILRRIVEKRQAQATYRQVGRSNNMFANHMQRQCVSQSMRDLERYQMCV